MAKLKHLSLREEIIETCLKMNEEGINQGTSGNVSARIDGGQRGLLLVLVEHVEATVVKHRRRRGAPPVARRSRWLRTLPHRRAVHREGEQADVTEERIDTFTISGRRFRRVAVLQVT